MVLVARCEAEGYQTTQPEFIVVQGVSKTLTFDKYILINILGSPLDMLYRNVTVSHARK